MHEENHEAPRCQWGIHSENPCLREATEQGPDEVVPNLCSAHARCIALGQDEDDWHYALEKLEEWSRNAAEEGISEHLDIRMTKARDEVREQYARAHTAAEAARFAANNHDGRLAPEQVEKLAVLMHRADAFADARTLLEDMPESAFGASDKWVVVDVLSRSVREACEEHERYKREIGLEGAGVSA
jgi:hypothetical protein